MITSNNNISNSTKLYMGKSPLEVISKYFYLIPWVLIFLLSAIFAGFIILRYSPKIYKVNGTVLLKDENNQGASNEKFEKILFLQPQKSINDELQIIRSTSLSKEVVKSLGLEISYLNKGKIRNTLLDNKETPVELRILKLNDINSNFTISVNVINDSFIRINNSSQQIPFDTVFENQYGRFSINKTSIPLSNFPDNSYIIEYAPCDKRSSQILGNITATESGNSENIILISYTTENPRLGTRIVNEWMHAYQNQGLNDKKRTAISALQFIKQQIDTVISELKDVESSLLSFKEKTKFINPQKQSELFIEKISVIDNELIDLNVKRKLLSNLKAHFNNNKELGFQVGLSLGIDDPTLLSQINDYNKLLLERSTLLKTTQNNNINVVKIQTALIKLRDDINASFSSLDDFYRISISSLERDYTLQNIKLSSIPNIESELVNLGRRQRILEELYSFLLQKKFETSISAASTLSNVKIVEPAYFSSKPIAPNPRQTYIISAFLGLFLPAIIIFLFEYLNDRVSSRQDINSITSAPILGEIGHNFEKNVLVATKNNRKYIAEQFRIIRTNLNYVSADKHSNVIMVTSTTSGEGKSFMSVNLSAVISLSGKKTILLEFDIRKPRVLASLGIKSQKGLVNYLMGESSLEDIILYDPVNEGFDVIGSGPLPPNPSELLLSVELSKLMAELLSKYDVVIIDTAPVGLVSDGFVLGKFVSSSIYVVRHNYTLKKQLELLNEVYTSNRLPGMSIIINDISSKGGYGSYYGYGGYGYYGNTYASKIAKDYFTDNSSNFFNDLSKRIRKVFSNFHKS